MRFMIMLKADAAHDAASGPGLAAAMAEYRHALARAGVLLDGAGLQPSAAGWRVEFTHGQPTVREGPCTRDADVVAGYALIEVRGRAEAQEWSRRFPALQGDGEHARIEVRELAGPCPRAADTPAGRA